MLSERQAFKKVLYLNKHLCLLAANEQSRFLFIHLPAEIISGLHYLHDVKCRVRLIAKYEFPLCSNSKFPVLKRIDFYVSKTTKSSSKFNCLQFMLNEPRLLTRLRLKLGIKRLDQGSISPIMFLITFNYLAMPIFMTDIRE